MSWKDKVTHLLSQKEILLRTPCVMLYSTTSFVSNIDMLFNESGLPSNTKHCLAVKANPLEYFLRIANNAGMSAEWFFKHLANVTIYSASYGEILLAQAAGFLSKDIVFDSPCKTLPELEFALSQYLTAVNISLTTPVEFTSMQTI